MLLLAWCYAGEYSPVRSLSTPGVVSLSSCTRTIHLDADDYWIRIPNTIKHIFSWVKGKANDAQLPHPRLLCSLLSVKMADLSSDYFCKMSATTLALDICTFSRSQSPACPALAWALWCFLEQYDRLWHPGHKNSAPHIFQQVWHLKGSSLPGITCKIGALHWVTPQ